MLKLGEPYANDAFLRSPEATPRRPRTVKRLRLRHVHRGTAGLHLHQHHLVPWEVARPGDAQLAVPMVLGGSRNGIPYEAAGASPVPLDALAGPLSSVESVVASASVFATRPLPGLRELILLGGRVEPGTWRLLPHLERLAVLHPAAGFDLGLVPAGLRALVLDGFWLMNAAGPAAFERVARLAGLEELVVDGHVTVSLAPVADLSRLRRLVVTGGRQHRRLGRLAALERVELRAVTLRDLTPFRCWTRVRELQLEQVGSLSGIEALPALARLTLRGRSLPGGLDRLASLPALRSLGLATLERLPDLGPLRALGGLRELEIAVGAAGEGELADLEFVRDMRGLERLELKAVVRDARLDALAGKPLRGGQVCGVLGPGTARTRRALERRGVRVHAVERPLGAAFLEPQRADDGASWYVAEDLCGALGTSENAAAERVVRRELRQRAPALARKLGFDSESAQLVMHAADEATIREAARLIRDLVAARVPRRAGSPGPRRRP